MNRFFCQVLQIHLQFDCCLVVVTRRLIPVDSDVMNPNERWPRDKVYDWFRCSGDGLRLSALVIYRHTKKVRDSFQEGTDCSHAAAAVRWLMGKNRTQFGVLWRLRSVPEEEGGEFSAANTHNFVWLFWCHLSLATLQ